MENSLKVAVGQSPAERIGPRAHIDWLEQSLNQIRDRKVDLLILPELFLCGYNIGDNVNNWAEEENGPFAQRISELARQFNIAIHYGYAEKQGSQLYNSASCMGKDGRLLGRHRKLLLPPGFEGDHFSPGNGCSLFKLGGFNISTLICYDAEFPENFRQVVAAGADLVLVPTALTAQWGVVSEKVIPSRAFENGVFVCYANHCGHENGMAYYGGSCIISPDGEDLARADASEAFLFATLDPGRVAAARNRLPYHIDRHKLPWRDELFVAGKS